MNTIDRSPEVDQTDWVPQTAAEREQSTEPVFVVESKPVEAPALSPIARIRALLSDGIPLNAKAMFRTLCSINEIATETGA